VLISKAPQIIAEITKQMMTDFVLGSQALPVACCLAAVEQMEISRLFNCCKPFVELCPRQVQFRREVLLFFEQQLEMDRSL
jgi:hypothetical protein